MSASLKKTIIDRTGRLRTITYKYKFVNLLIGKSTYIAANDPKKHSVVVLVSRWNRVNPDGIVLGTKTTASGRLKITRYR